MQHTGRKWSRKAIAPRIEEAKAAAAEKREELGFARELPENLEYEAARAAVKAARRKRGTKTK